MSRNDYVCGLDRDGGGPIVGGGSSKKSDGFIDRSKVRILLCDNDSTSSQEVLTLLCKCSYQVTSVKSARQIIDALNAEGPDIDIILTEVDLPLAKGMKLLKYITRDSNLSRIPVIMMSTQDEVSVVVKCLRFGAADYLVKPLRSNELLNLWTHMWRRRRMLGLTEKNILSFDVDVVASDPSDANTNSITLFSDDTDEKSRKCANLDACIPAAPLEADFIASASLTATPALSPGASHMELQQTMCYCPKDPISSDRQTGSFSSGPKKSKLKLGESSAFFTYVKSSINRSSSRGITNSDVNNAQSSKDEDMTPVRSETLNGVQTNENGGGKLVDENSNCKGMLETFFIERSCTPLVTWDSEQPRNLVERVNLLVPNQKRDEPLHDTQRHASYSYYMSGIMNQVMMPPSAWQHYQKNIHDLQNHAIRVPSQFAHHLPQCPPHVPSFPYYPYNLCLQPGQIPTTHPWEAAPHGGSAHTEVKLGKFDRREAALIKFKQKRKERCFDKKIRYVNRKKLAERRPRVRGQFVRKMNGVNVDLNGLPSPELDAEEEDEFDDEHASRDSSNDNDALES
ncbi:hypothetical protein QQ045_030690 [Rhodiola kirilowii]